MKNYAKRLLSLALSVVVCLTCLQITAANAAAGSYDITLTGFTLPRPGAVPKGAASFTSSANYSLIGWDWEGSEGVYFGSDSFGSFYTSVMDAMGESGNTETFSTFTDTRKYSYTAMYVLKGVSINSAAALTIKDTSGNVVYSGESANIVSASMFKSMVPDLALPSGVTTSDSLLMFTTNSFLCSPTSHDHDENGGYVCDEKYHYKSCSVCGKKLLDSRSAHHCPKYEYRNWTVVKAPTQTEAGLWESRCQNCNYAEDSVIVPAKQDQTIVNDYDGLRAALAKGGKQWITIEPPYLKWLTQNTNETNYTLCVDDPSADITLDLNGAGISRETLYDSCLFDIKAGSLRVIQKSLPTMTNGTKDNLGFFSAASKRCVFNVEEAGTLRVDNICGYCRSDEYFKCYPVIRSKGNVIIDSGIYENYRYYTTETAMDENQAEYAPVRIIGGKLTVNGGSFDSRGVGIAAVTDYAYSKPKNIVINDGYIYGAMNGMYLDEYTTAQINDGIFERIDRETYSAVAVRANSCDLTINNGSFYGTDNALKARSMKNLTINYGYFRTTSEYSEKKYSAFLLSNSTSNVVIKKGEFAGVHGITYMLDVSVSPVYLNFQLSSILAPNCTAYDKASGAVDTSTASSSFGTEYLEIKSSPTVLKYGTYTINDIKIPFPGDEVTKTAAAGDDKYTVELTPMLAVSEANHGVEYNRRYYNFDEGDSYYYTARLIPAAGYKFDETSYSGSTFRCNSKDSDGNTVEGTYIVLEKHIEGNDIVAVLYPYFDDGLHYYGNTKGFYRMFDYPYGSGGWYPFNTVRQPSIAPYWNTATGKPSITVKNYYEPMDNTVGLKMKEWGSPGFEYRLTKNGKSTNWTEFAPINGGNGDFGSLDTNTDYIVEIRNKNTQYIYKKVTVHTSSVPGDVNENGIIDKEDAKLALSYLSYKQPELTRSQIVAARFADGESAFDILDVTAILKNAEE